MSIETEIRLLKERVRTLEIKSRTGNHSQDKKEAFCERCGQVVGKRHECSPDNYQI